MTLGQTIAQLRKEKKLSQDELADLLGVSRQSVSKWETDASVPELDKLVRLSDMFGVTLDALIRGEESAPALAQVAPVQAPAAPVEAAFPPRKIAGTILFCMGFLCFLFCTFLGGIWTGLALASPFLICGGICFIFRRRVGLWCGWALYLLLDLYLAYATGISRSMILYSFAWTREMNFIRLGTAWVITGIFVLLVICTLRSFRDTVLPWNRRSILPLAVSAGVLLLLRLGEYLVNRFVFGPRFNAALEAGTYRDYHLLFQSVNFTFSWLSIAALTVLLCQVAALIRGRRK